MYISLLYVLFFISNMKKYNGSIIMIMASSNQPILPDESDLIRQVLL